MRLSTLGLALIVLCSPAVSLAQGLAPAAKPLSKKARIVTCKAVYEDNLTVGFKVNAALCLGKGVEYIKSNEDDVEIQMAFIGSDFNAKDGVATSATHICQVYLEKGPRGSLAPAVETCITLDAPTSCEAKVGVETQKALVRKFPSIAHSFGLGEVVLVSSALGVDRYSVGTTDEVESSQWEVETSSDASAACVIKSVRFVQ